MDEEDETNLMPPTLEPEAAKPEDLFGDGSAMKTVLAPGVQVWKHPKEGGEAQLSLKATAEGGESIEERRAFDYVLGSGALGPLGRVVDKALLGMTTQEKCSVVCAKDSMYEGSGHGLVTLELRLHSIATITDVSLLKDGTVTKKVTKQGDGFGKPSDDGYQVTVKVESVQDEAGASLQGFSGPAEFSFELCSGDACDAIDGAVRDMKKGERAVLTCTSPAKMCEPRLGLVEVQAKRVVMALELLDFKKGQDAWGLPDSERVDMAMQRKDAGAKLFAAKRFELALEKYKKVIDTIPNHDRFPDELKARAVEIKRVAELNKAACFLKLGNSAGALESCDKVLQEDKNNVKALFRRARARHDCGNHMGARADLDLLLDLDPANAEAKALLQHVNKAQRLVDKRSQGTFSKMCQGLGTMGSDNRSTAAGPQWELKPSSSKELEGKA